MKEDANNETKSINICLYMQEKRENNQTKRLWYNLRKRKQELISKTLQFNLLVSSSHEQEHGKT